MIQSDPRYGPGFYPLAFGAIHLSVATTDSLRRLAVATVSVGTLILVRSTGGLFWYDAANEEDEDGSTIIEPDMGSGRWVVVQYTAAVGGANRRTMTAVLATDYTATEDDDIVRFSGNRTCTLPTATEGNQLTIHSAGGLITIVPAGGETVLGASSHAIEGANNSVTLVGTGSDWILVA